MNTVNRIFSEIYASDDTVAFFAPIRAYSISPKCGPVNGGTIVTIIGTGFH